MMNRSLMGRQMFANGGPAMADPMAQPMDMGEAPMGMGQTMGMGEAPMDMGQPMPMGLESLGVDPAMAMNPDNPNNLDPDVLNNAMMSAAESFGNLDEADDYEGMINSIRGDKLPMADRVSELATLVGSEDAQQTPESVLALVQPVILMNSMDQGIGSIAEDAMGSEITGDMAGGIMSTVNMEPPMDPGMNPAMAQAMPMDPGMPMGMEVGNAPPVNFRYGGSVAYMQAGGEPTLVSEYEAVRPTYQNIMGDFRAEDAAAFEEQKNLTQGQMFFDVANTALAFASPGSTQMSPAQRLAEAATETKLLDKFGARAQSLQDLTAKQKAAERSDRRSLDLAALGSAEKSMDRFEASKLALEKARLSRTGMKQVQWVHEDSETFPTLMRDINNMSQEDSATLYGLGYTPISVSSGSRAKVPTKMMLLVSSDPTIPDTLIDINSLTQAEKDNYSARGFSFNTFTSKSEPLSNSMQILQSNKGQNLAAWAAGGVGGYNDNIGGALLDLASDQTSVDDSGTIITKSASPLPAGLANAVRQRAALTDPATGKPLFPDILTNFSAVLPKQPEVDYGDLNDPNTLSKLLITQGQGTGYLPQKVTDSSAFNLAIQSPTGAINKDSPVWKRMQGDLYGNEALEKAFGPGEVTSIVRNFFDGITQDVITTSDGQVDLNEAQQSLRALGYQYRKFLMSARTDRLLKMEAEDVRALSEPFEPGIFKPAAAGLTAIKSAKKQVADTMRLLAKSQPDFRNGTKTKETAADKNLMNRAKLIMVNLTAFETNLSNHLDNPKNKTGSSADMDKTALNNLVNLTLTPTL